ncbi:MAG: carbonate dehydratase [Alphaproteobacteria bacterium]|nr:carbonate dehydratase [Alphaproteobacteria bacterium]
MTTMTVSIRASLAMGALALAGLACLALAQPASGETPANDEHGGEWGGVCASGTQQSPVDLSGAISASASPLKRGWHQAASAVVLNNGHTVQVDAANAGDVVIGGVTYKFLQVHFHHPSEHTIDGKSFPMEAHLVHQSADGRIAVVGVLFGEGAANPELNRIIAAAPEREGKVPATFPVDPGRLVPAHAAAFRYMGSLTTPPCSETVTWTVVSQPLTASREQLAKMAAKFPDNARHVHPLNRRYILKTAF